MSRLKYSRRYNVCVDPTDLVVYDARSKHYGKVLTLKKYDKDNYSRSNGKCRPNLYLHRVIADACVPNPRPDIFDVVDHIDSNTENNNPENLRWVNQHLNMINLKMVGINGERGVSFRKGRYKSGHWYSIWVFKKANKVIFSNKNKEIVLFVAKTYHDNIFDKLHEAYVFSPAPGTPECAKYWLNVLICAKRGRVPRQEILRFEKFIVTANIFKRLTQYPSE